MTGEIDDVATESNLPAEVRACTPQGDAAGATTASVRHRSDRRASRARECDSSGTTDAIASPPKFALGRRSRHARHRMTPTPTPPHHQGVLRPSSTGYGGGECTSSQHQPLRATASDGCRRRSAARGALAGAEIDLAGALGLQFQRREARCPCASRRRTAATCERPQAHHQ